MSLLKRKEKPNKKEDGEKSYESVSGSIRQRLELFFPWMAKGSDADGPSFRIKSGAWRHGTYTTAELASFAMVALTIINSAVLTGRYAAAFFGLQDRVIVKNLILAVITALLPFLAWARATDENFWAYHRRKRVFFGLALVHAALCLLQPLYSVIWSFIVPFIIRNVQVNAAMTRRMVVLLAYLAEGALLSGAVILLYRVVEPILKSKMTWRSIEIFKLRHVMDSRKNAENRYDFTALTDLETGKRDTIKEHDRYLQAEINGASGTGKTSSIFLNGIWGDLNVKFKNREARREEYARMISEGKATIQGPLSEFEESAVIAIGKNEKELRKNEKELRDVKEKYPDCGITVVAPNSDLNVAILKMAEARGFKVNVLDPVNSYDSWSCAREMSINPFYLPPGLETVNFDKDNELVIRISQAASAFADVLIATNQMGGASDVYFTDISLSVSSNVAAVVMLGRYLKNQQTYIDDVHECISDFGNLAPYVETIESTYNIKVLVDDPRAKGENASASQNGKTTAGKVDEKTRKNPYYQQLLFVKQELLGPGREQMFSQARGLRNLITKILQDPRIKRKLSATGDARLDFDRILSNNEITVVSTAVELGQSISTSFGIFFLLLHRTSVLRRPKATRTPHFLWVDECAQYIHHLFSDVIALYRQYCVAAVLTLQTLTQLEKYKETAYLKNVFLGAGTHIVFGRVAVEEMELYGKMAGQIREDVEQVSSTSNDVLASNPTYTESTRKTPTITNVMEGSDLRHLDFQELTLFTVDGGRVLYGRHARVFFLPDEAYDEMKQKPFDWKGMVPEAFREKTQEEKKREAKIKANAEKENLEEIPSEVQEVDATSFVAEKSDAVGQIEDGDEEAKLKKMIEEAGDLNEIYAKLSSGEW